MLATVNNSKVFRIRGIESTVRITKKFPGSFPQESELQEVAVGYCSDIEVLLVSPFPLVAFITQGENELSVPRSFFNHYRIFSTVRKLHCCSRL